MNIVPSDSGEETEFSLQNCYLGKAELYHVNLKSYGRVCVHNSHIVDCSFVNINWPKDIYAFPGLLTTSINHNKKFQNKIIMYELAKWHRPNQTKEKKDSQIREYYSNKRETLRQIKYALSKQGDVINEQTFHYHEMIAYDKSIGLEHAWTKLILKMSLLTSDFGQSVWKPIIWLFAGNLMLFTILLISDAFYPLQFNFSNPTEAGFEKGLYHYMRLLNPLRKAEDHFQGSLIIIDYLIRIWTSYMIYNFIRASRRFLK